MKITPSYSAEVTVDVPSTVTISEGTPDVTTRTKPVTFWFVSDNPGDLKAQVRAFRDDLAASVGDGGS